jgi:protein-S-isoprenylcysteine O-methyltransferase Ste14
VAVFFDPLHRHAVVDDTQAAQHILGGGPIVDTARYVAGVLVVTFLPPGLLWWFLIHPFVDFWRGVGPKKTLIVMGVVGVGGVAALLPVRDELLIRDLGSHPATYGLALALIVTSVAIAIQRRKQLDSRTLAGVPELDREAPGKLLTGGIYDAIRHPRYVEVAIGTLGYAVFSMWLGALVIALLTLPVLHLIVLIEERELADRFGDEYERYRARVPRYVPRFGSSSKS